MDPGAKATAVVTNREQRCLTAGCEPGRNTAPACGVGETAERPCDRVQQDEAHRMAPLRNHQPIQRTSVYGRGCMGVDRREARSWAPARGNGSEEAGWEERLRTADRHPRRQSPNLRQTAAGLG